MSEEKPTPPQKIYMSYKTYTDSEGIKRTVRMFAEVQGQDENNPDHVYLLQTPSPNQPQKTKE